MNKTAIQIFGKTNFVLPQQQLIARVIDHFPKIVQVIPDYAQHLRERWDKENAGIVNPGFDTRIREIQNEAERFGEPMVGIIGQDQFEVPVLVIVGTKQFVARFLGKRKMPDFPYSEILEQIKSIAEELLAGMEFEKVEV